MCGVPRQRLQTKVLAHPDRRTDIRSTIQVAAQEYALDEPGIERVLIVLSDSPQDDGAMNFAASPSLQNIDSAKTRARQLANSQHLPQPMHVFLGSLRSNEIKQLGRERRAAIIAFWKEYFSAMGSTPAFVVDGPSVVAGLPMSYIR